MKKLFVFAVACVLSVAAMAEQTAYVQIKLIGKAQKDASVAPSQMVVLTEDDAAATTYQSGYDSQKQDLSQGIDRYKVILYAQAAYTGDDEKELEAVYLPNLDGVKLAFKTNKMDDTYYLSFANFSGRELKLYDAEEDKVITINASTHEYEFTVKEEDKGQMTITNRFSIGEPAPVPYEICHRYGKLQVSGYQGGTVIVKDANGDEKINVVVPTRSQYDINLVDAAGAPLEDGNYTVEANGETLIIKVGN
jgi:hypothetical protein